MITGSVTAVSRNAEWSSRLDGVAGVGAFRADGRGGCRFAAGSAVIPATGSVLGADYNSGDHPIVVGCGAHCVLAAFRRDGTWSSSGRDRGESLRAARARIRHLRV